MSDNDHQLERGYSSHSVSSRGNSETGSSYQYESRLSISSFAATIFVSGVITMGISLITLVIALTTMLQSCRSQASGMIENHRSYYNGYYCNIAAFHMELNQLDIVELPSICKNYAASYISEGQFLRDLNFSIFMAEKYFLSLQPPDHVLTAVLMDIDDILPSSALCSKPLKNSCRDCIEEAIKSRRMLVLRLYNKIKEGGWPLILVTKRSQDQRNIITKYLISAGYMEWKSLMMRSAEEVMLSSLEYFSRKITALERQEYHIAGVISSNLDALAGISVRKRVFKLPNMKFLNIACSNSS